MKANRKSIWRTVPAILTSVAALIKAINGLFEAVRSTHVEKVLKEDISSKPLQESNTNQKSDTRNQIKNLK